MERVSVSRCPSYDRGQVERAVREAVDAVGGFAAYVQPGEKVLLKPNLLVASDPAKAVTTHPEVMRAVIRGCQEAGGEVWVGDSPGFGHPARAAERSGIMDACRDTGALFVPFTEAERVSFPEGRAVKSFPLAKAVVEADKVISVAKLKTHGFTIYTGAVKNLYGTIVGPEKARLHFSFQEGRDFSRMLLDLYRLVRPALSIIDAVVGMEGPGPRSGSPRNVGLVLAGADGLAVDTVGAAIMGLDIRQVPYLALAAELGEGAVGLEQVEVAGVPLAEAKVPGFQLPPTAHETNFPRWINDLTRRFFTAKPVVIPELCIACGICRESCPAEAITVESKAEIDSERCIRCYCCQEMCPEGAIELRQNVIARLLPWR